MILVIGIFVIGVAFIALLGFLLGVAMDGEIGAGIVTAAIVPFLVGTYNCGEILVNKFNWIQ